MKIAVCTRVFTAEKGQNTEIQFIYSNLSSKIPPKFYGIEPLSCIVANSSHYGNIKN